MIKVHGYTESGAIRATIDGQEYTIPDDMGNRHRQMIEDSKQKIAPYVRQYTSGDVDAERDRRIGDGFNFMGEIFQSRPADIENVQGAATAAALAILGGAQPGDLRWANPDEDFAWLNAANQPIGMDAFTFGKFAGAVMAHKSYYIWKGRQIKDRETIPDPTDDSLWA